MFENLYRVDICITEFGITDKIIINNEKKDISKNGKYKNILLNDYYSFLDSFFRVIREWNNENNSQLNIDNKYIINIRIIEKEKEYEMCINKYTPDNLDSFLRLINNLKEG